jgi:D-glycero-alpha-D-manno-heptose 1-phosphate guanylyltransferase
MTVTCIVLAGGLGTRLKTVVPTLPKCLAPIAGLPFLSWQLRSLAERGVQHFVLALGYGAHDVLASLSQSWANEFSISTIIESRSLGTGGSAHFALKESGLDEALVVNGDTFLGGSLDEMMKPLDSKCGELMRVATVALDDRERFGGLMVNHDHKVTAFLDKGQVGAGIVNAGLYRIHRNVFDDNVAQRVFSIEMDVMPQLVIKGALQAREIAGPFIDIGVPDDYHLFNSHIQDYIQNY